ncbi:unnamed protein product [Leptidea sinapis]|uniref:Uncharacterized protein n=1 Tax=Leptidea sinapis TaxID=189913 RepID=A0A5E4Q6X7_9NEOP|nr:unnamed protein product [Leptidea sinapis]
MLIKQAKDVTAPTGPLPWRGEFLFIVLPSKVHTDLTLAPSAHSSSNSSPGLNLVLKVDEVTSTYASPSFLSSTVGVTALAALQVQTLSPFWTCFRVLPSKVHTDLTLAPSARSSSNSSPGLNFISVVLKVDEVTSTYASPSFLSSTVGVTALAALRVIRPSPIVFMNSSKFFEEGSMKIPIVDSVAKKMKRLATFLGNAGNSTLTLKRASVNRVSLKAAPKNINNDDILIQTYTSIFYLLNMYICLTNN